MTEVNELTLVRQHNILKLQDDMKPATMKDIAKKMGVKYATFATIIRPVLKANIGGKVTKMIEASLKLSDGWLDVDRRDGVSPPDAAPSRNGQNVVSMNANGFVVVDKSINNHQANEIMKVLLES